MTDQHIYKRDRESQDFYKVLLKVWDCCLNPNAQKSYFSHYAKELYDAGKKVEPIFGE